jgi:rod shape-determining protein MreC
MNRPADRRPWILFLLLGLAILILALHETGQLELAEDLLSLVTGPIQRAASDVVQGVSDTFASVEDARELQAQIEELQEVADDLTAQGVRLREVEEENARLRDLLNFVSANPTLRGYVGGDVIAQGGLVEGEVIGQDPSPYIYYLIINRGSRDGLEIGMPVVAGGGRLVGRVADVRIRWSKVQLLIDPSSRVKGVVQVSRATGLVTGQPDGSLTLEQIPQSEQVDVGDIVVTTGRSEQGGLIPKGLIIGYVSAVEKQDIEPYQKAVLQPAVDFRRLELVLVITDFEPLPLDEEPSESSP